MEIKKWIILILFLCANFLAGAQDYIIIKTGEKIDCTIQKVDSSKIYFGCILNGKVVNTSLSRTEIAEFGPLTQYHGVKINQLTFGKPAARISLSAGGGYLFTATPKIILSDQSAYIKKMRLGFSYGGEITILPKDIIGFGLKYLVYETSNTNPSLSAEDNLRTSYVGPSLSIKRDIGLKGLAVIFGLSMGYLKNSNSGTKFASPFYIDGSTLGYEASIGMDYRFGSNIALGFDFSLLGGSISKYTVNSISTTLSSNDNLLIANLTGGVRFYF